MNHPKVLRTVHSPEGLPSDGEAVLIGDVGAWDADDIAAALRCAADGSTVVLATAGIRADDAAAEAWFAAAGVRRSVAFPRAEVVIEPGVHPVVRNVAESVIDLAHRVDAHTLEPIEAKAVLRTPLALTRHAVVTERTVGRGSVVAVALPEWDSLPSAHVVPAVVRRLVARTEGFTHSMGIGIVGYGQHGGMGWLHGRAAAATDGLHLAAIAELDAARLKQAGERFPAAALHGSVDGLLEDDGVDIVVVATPPSTHYDLTCRAITSGRHVVVEKPLCFTAEEADRLIDRATTAAVSLTVHQNRRWDSDFRAISALVDSGRLGDVFNIETFVGSFEHPCTLWHSDRAVSGGRLYDWGAHLIDQTLQIYGDATPTRVTATGHKRVWHDVTNLDQIRVRLHFADGREAEFLDSDILAVRRPKYTVQGTRGTVTGSYVPVVEERVTPDEGYQLTQHHHAEGPARLRFAEHHTGWGLQDVAIPGLPAAPFPFHRALADHVQLADAVPVDPAGVRTVVAVLEAATRSAEEGGRPVTPA